MNYYKVEIVFWRNMGEIDAVTLSTQAATPQAAELAGVEQAVACFPGRKVQAVDVVPFLGAYRVRRSNESPWMLAQLDRVETELEWWFIGTEEKEAFATAGLEYQWLGSVEPLIASPELLLKHATQAEDGERVPVDLTEMGIVVYAQESDATPTPERACEHVIPERLATGQVCDTKGVTAGKYKIKESLEALNVKVKEQGDEIRVLLMEQAHVESERDDLDSENEELVRQLHEARARFENLELILREKALQAEIERPPHQIICAKDEGTEMMAGLVAHWRQRAAKAEGELHELRARREDAQVLIDEG